MHVLGILDGGAASLTPAALAVVQRAEVLVGGTRHLGFFPQVAAERVPIKGDLEAVLGAVAAAYAAGKRVVVLASGDPLFYGIGARVVHLLGREHVRVIPNVSAMQLAFAAIGEPWEDAVLASVHGRPMEAVVDLVRRSPKIALFTDQDHSPPALARLLLAEGVPDRVAYVCENLGGPAQRVVPTRLSQLPTQTFAPLNVLVLMEDGAR